MAIPSTMQAIEIREPGDPNVLQLCTREVPTPGAGEVLVRVAAAGVNRPDCLQRRGLYKVPPDASDLPGLEIAGEVVSCGGDVKRWRLGDRIVALTHGGGYAEYCVAQEGHCLDWPAALTSSEAAALPETCFTVQHNLLTRAALTPNDVLLVHGGSSGIGTTAIQVAAAMGVEVIVTAGSAEKCAYCLDLGAKHAVNYRETDWFETVQSLRDGGGVDVVLDMVAGPYVEKNLRVLNHDGRYAMIAFLLGHKAEVNFAEVLTKRLTITGSTLRPQSNAQKSAIARACEAHMWPMIANGSLRAPIYATFPLADAWRAHALMESSEHMGKIVLTVSTNDG